MVDTALCVEHSSRFICLRLADPGAIATRIMRIAVRTRAFFYIAPMPEFSIGATPV